ncbi:hypothetical protein M409DRAFT_17579 [Zasmidium cellare ATCC 36951]|uniref:Uncharacterized protein n=1 Tax=Zasmidium cellare ATCC 36951 TaxID=1080233 RepID=A0A6A6CYT8_ZASCE|nr:uncharacterized protein M409DRAFT_17579 [Zasmidium cellare ATCC 36951]KAF2172344.1 hypothetical protein M409DRAFT_17579 [Zasmidium cellare ATCC 36951]
MAPPVSRETVKTQLQCDERTLRQLVKNVTAKMDNLKLLKKPAKDKLEKKEWRLASKTALAQVFRSTDYDDLRTRRTARVDKYLVWCASRGRTKGDSAYASVESESDESSSGEDWRVERNKDDPERTARRKASAGLKKAKEGKGEKKHAVDRKFFSSDENGVTEEMYDIATDLYDEDSEA